MGPEYTPKENVTFFLDYISKWVQKIHQQIEVTFCHCFQPELLNVCNLCGYLIG